MTKTLGMVVNGAKEAIHPVVCGGESAGAAAFALAPVFKLCEKRQVLRITEKNGGVVVDIAVKPRSSREAVGPAAADRLVVAVNAPPVDGKANEAVLRVLAERFGVPRSAVTIVRGETGRKKTVHLAGVTAAAVARVAEGGGS